MWFNWITIIIIAGIVYFILMLLSLNYSCGGYAFRECGFCWVGIVQIPLNCIDWFYDKVRKKEKKE